MSAAPNLTQAERESLNAVTASGSWAMVYAVVSDLLRAARAEEAERLAGAERERDAWKRTADMRSTTAAADRLLAIEAAFDAYPGTTRLHRAVAVTLGRPSANERQSRALDAAMRDEPRTSTKEDLNDLEWRKIHYTVVRSHGCDDPAPECACGSPLTPHNPPGGDA